MRYYLGSTQYKWKHANLDVEHLWVRRELGEELFKQCNLDGHTLVYLRSDSQELPPETYCRCDIYVDVDNKHNTFFALKFPSAVATPEMI